MEGIAEGERNKKTKEMVVELNVTSRDYDRWKILSCVSALFSVGGDSEP